MRENLAIVRLQQELSAANEPRPLAAPCNVRPLWRTRRYDWSWPMVLKNSMLKWLFSVGRFSGGVVEAFLGDVL
jgi:hypothetical protein